MQSPFSDKTSTPLNFVLQAGLVGHLALFKEGIESMLALLAS